jgi:hypothetical protein
MDEEESTEQMFFHEGVTWYPFILRDISVYLEEIWTTELQGS